MKRVIYVLIIALIVLGYSCKKDSKTEIEPLYLLNIQLKYPDKDTVTENVTIKINNSINNSKAEIKTDKRGFAKIELDLGEYDIKVSERRNFGGVSTLFNGFKSVTINKNWKKDDTLKIDLEKSKVSQLIIKEMYLGGVPKDDGSGVYVDDKYAILYNNSEFPVYLNQNTALAITYPPYTCEDNEFIQGGKLTYESENWIPAGQAVWYFNRVVEIKAYSQIVIAFFRAVDNTHVFTKSISFANPEYFCTYDPDVFAHPEFYVTPSEKIPTENYLKALDYGVASAWMLTYCPAFYIFTPKNTDLKSFVLDPLQDVFWLEDFKAKKVPTDWIIDGVEIFDFAYQARFKRLTSNVDAGYIQSEPLLGYSVYRNVDKEATEAIEGNKEKLVYGYSLGTINTDGESTDPSGIDAEASIKNGAKIIYKDTNNSTEDFHQRAKASLRTN